MNEKNIMSDLYHKFKHKLKNQTRSCFLKGVLPIFLIMILPFVVLANVNSDGSYSYSIPIEVSVGAGHKSPDISLEYNSSIGNGWLGMGWSLAGIPTITRMNHGKGIRYNNQDTFVGPDGRLVDMDGDGKYHSGDIYHSAVE